MTRRIMHRTVAAATILLATGIAPLAMAQTPNTSAQVLPVGTFATTDATDPYLWLEDVQSERVDAWVAEKNAHSLGTLQADPRYEGLYQNALDILQSRDRIPAVSIQRDGTLENFWQDAQHVRGIWRRTTMDSYKTSDPQWETILDFDALAAAEGANWVYKGATCLEPEGRYCLVSLSDGGKDAVTIREFDKQTGKFVEGGISLPESKSGISWIDRDTLLVSYAVGDENLTTSGYPRSVRILKRGQTLDQAVEVFKGEQTDMMVSAYGLRDADGVLKATIIQRMPDFYNSDKYLLKADGSVEKLALPSKGGINSLVNGKLVITTDEDWTAPSGQTFKTGDIFSYNLDAWMADPASRAELILSPGEREAVEGINNTRNKLIVALYENVRGSIYVYDTNDWSRTRLNLPENVTVGIGSASETNDQFFASISGYLTPSTYYLADASTGAVEVSKSLPPKFDATGLVVDQHQATSKDGTLIPYFVVRKADAPNDGSNPTLLYGYGGFQSSLLPSYSGTIGKLWLERGGIYVIANTRGGGEFGPRWHQLPSRKTANVRTKTSRPWLWI